MIIPDPYMCGETCGLKKASELKPRTLGKKLAQADKVLFVLASEVDRYPEDVLKKMIKKSSATVFKTEAAQTGKIDIDADERYGLMEITDRLCNGMGDKFDYIILAGVPYHIETRVLSGLRAYGIDGVVTLNWRHQQYADYSFPNLPSAKGWEKSLSEIVEEM